MVYDSTVNNKTKENEFSRVIIKYGNEMATMKKEDMLVPGRPSYQFPYDYVEDYITQKNFNEKKLAKEGLDRRRKYQLRNTRALKKLDIYRLAFIMGMNKTEVIQFMILAGHSFSPLDPLDVFFLNYLNGKYGKITSLFELSNLASEKCNKIFMYCEE